MCDIVKKLSRGAIQKNEMMVEKENEIEFD